MKPLKIAILWHMHQPDYRDPVSGKTLLPWTYLHAVKDYGEMLKTAEEIEGARMTFNLVPTMLEQIEGYATGKTRDVWIEAAAKNPKHMEEDERIFLLTQFFSVNTERHVLPYKRYRELAAKREKAGKPDPKTFSEQDLRDLQVWFLLAWSGHYLRRESDLIPYLMEKGEQFTEGEKENLLKLYDAAVADVIGLYRKLEEKGTVEISITPYAHPILPLLCGTEIASHPTPGIRLPSEPFRHPEDARLQVRYGLRRADHFLGARKRGMWPSEGSVSEETVRILKEEGALWAATDEGILAKSLDAGLRRRQDLYRPYAFEGFPLFFRDLELSDRIGFVYAHWNPKEAAADLIHRLKMVAKTAHGGVIPLILDGENCWERYEDNGYPFLSSLYRGIVKEPSLEMTTFSEILVTESPAPLNRVAAGSWINSDFCIWIGHPEENTAWEWLERARRDVSVEKDVRGTLESKDTKPTEKTLHLLRAEGSDWFWWYGDDHVTAQADIFDLLFRRHLEALYRESGRPVPSHLAGAIKAPIRERAVRPPSALFTPSIDGRVSDYFEWLAAGSADLSPGGAMHAAHHEFTTLLYGYDEKSLYLRLDPQEDIRVLTGDEGYLEVRLHSEEDWRMRVAPGVGPPSICRVSSGEKGGEGAACCGHIVEIAIPLPPLKISPGDDFILSIHLYRDGAEEARWPAEGSLKLPYKGEELEHGDWLV